MSKLKWYNTVVAISPVDKDKVMDASYLYAKIGAMMQKKAQKAGERYVFILKDFEIIFPSNPIEKPSLRIKLKKVPILNKIKVE